jgi:methylmalonyl-CoA/ethylmalonyl-CoA epimerase
MTSAGIVALDHIAVVVRDIEASLAYYTCTLGLPIVSDEETEASGGARLVFLDAGNVMIQLISPLRSTGPIAGHLETHGEGIHHLCFAVGDIKGAIAALVPEQDVPVEIGGRGRRTAFLPNRTDGVITELTETAARIAPSD